MLDPHLVYLAVILSLIGGGTYVRDTIRGVTSPHKVTWALWSVEGIMAFVLENQQHVGIASLMSLVLGLVPLAVVISSFMSANAAWKIDTVDVVCGAVSVFGMIFWGLVQEPTLALVFFTMANVVAALPTFRKSWRAPESETLRMFILGAVNTGITLLTLKQLSTAGALFPGSVMITDILLSILIATGMGQRLARRPRIMN